MNEVIAEKLESYYRTSGDSKSNKIYVLGRNEYSASIIKSQAHRVEAVIDDFTRQSEYHGKPVVTQIEANKSLKVVSCSMSVSPFSAIQSLRKNGFEKIVGYPEYYAQFSELLEPPQFINNYYEKIEPKKIEWLKSILADKESLRVLDLQLDFRRFGDVLKNREFGVDFDKQYFSSVCQVETNDVFVDGGGFDGETSLNFIRRCPNYSSIYLFEPDPDNMSDAKNNLSKYSKVNLIQKGLSSRSGVARFCDNAQSNASIDPDGRIEIELTTIDEALSEPPTFIKLDLEGADFDAIVGAKNTIERHKPKMAISVYHDITHFWLIPELILSLSNDYKVYLRQYTEGWSETIMYFIPLQKKSI